MADTKIIVDCSTGITTEVELTAEEVAQRETDALAAEARRAEEDAARETLATLKASARTKLISGQPLTEEEAATIVL